MVETILQIFCNHQQDNWADWLKIAQYMINSRPSATTKKPPYELWMGFIPRTHQPMRVGNVPAIEERKSQLDKLRLWYGGGEVFYGLTDWLGSRDPMTPYNTHVAHRFGLDD
jgi:hypothetical protein